MTISVGTCLKRKAVSVSEGVHEQNFANCKVFCSLQELYTTFNEKHLNVNIKFSKFCTLRPKWYLLAGSKMTRSVYVCGAHQNIVLPVDTMGSGFTHKSLIKLTLFCLKYSH